MKWLKNTQQVLGLTPQPWRCVYRPVASWHPGGQVPQNYLQVTKCLYTYTYTTAIRLGGNSAHLVYYPAMSTEPR